MDFFYYYFFKPYSGDRDCLSRHLNTGIGDLDLRFVKYVVTNCMLWDTCEPLCSKLDIMFLARLHEYSMNPNSNDLHLRSRSQGYGKTRILCSHSAEKLLEVTQTFAMANYVREMV